MPEPPWYAALHYAGRDFAGWQRQPAARTVQGEIERVLERVAGRRVVVHGAGRTDAGVHALGQVMSFRLTRRWEPPALARALNALLPDDIWVYDVLPGPPDFHARKHATARRYRYVIGCDEAAASPFRRPYEWALRRPLEAASLAAAAAAFVGDHDFRAFAAAGSDKPHYRCRITTADWQARTHREGYIFTVEADRFLHRMVRFMVGTMVDVGLGRRSPEDIPRLLAERNNAGASSPAPPEGLYLECVRYPHLAKDDRR